VTGGWSDGGRGHIPFPAGRGARRGGRACTFAHASIPQGDGCQIPDNGLNRLADRILLFRHDYCSPNVLQLINCATDVIDETLVEIVLTANRELCKNHYILVYNQDSRVNFL
ncbi:Protein kinase c, partial [Operophtera brumata]